MRSERVQKLADGQIENIFTRKMETPKSTAYMVWHNDDMPYTLKNAIYADIAGQVLSMVYLKKIREEASAAYTCGAQGSASIGDDDFHQMMLLAYCPMKPEKKQEAIDIMNAEVPALAQTCDAEMLQKVKETMLKHADDAAKTNQYWNNVLQRYQKYGIDIHTDYKQVVSTATPADIQNFMKEFLKDGNKATVIMLPEE